MLSSISLATKGLISYSEGEGDPSSGAIVTKGFYSFSKTSLTKRLQVLGLDSELTKTIDLVSEIRG